MYHNIIQIIPKGEEPYEHYTAVCEGDLKEATVEVFKFIYYQRRTTIYNSEDYILKKLFILALTLLIAGGNCFATDINSIKASIVKHSIELGVDPAITLSIARTESGFRHEARSSHGAVGVFQLLPSTAKRMGLNAYSLNDNIKGGIMYYKSMYKMFGSMELALAAYNAGPGNVKRYNNSVPPYSETKRFIAKIMTDYNKYKSNPDPAMINTQTVKPKASVVPVKQAPVPVPVKEEDRLQIETVDETPIELELTKDSYSI